KAVFRVQVFDDDGRRGVLGEQAVYAVVDLLQTRREGLVAVGGDDPADDDHRGRGTGLDEPIPGGHEAGIDAEEPVARQPRWPRVPRRECRSWRRRTVRRPDPPAPR